MYPPPLIADEHLRLACLAEYGFDAQPEEPSLDSIVALAARMFNVPMAVVNLIGNDTVSLAANHGIGELDPKYAGRDISFCAHTITQDEVMVVEDATQDPRFHDNPLVTGESEFRFYAGVPLRSPTGHQLGAFCIIDTRARAPMCERDLAHLRELASLVLDRLELRRLDVAQRVSQARFEHIAATSPDAIICSDAHGKVTAWNDAAVAMFGYTADEMLGSQIERLAPEHLRRLISDDRALATQGLATRLIGKTTEFFGLRKDGSSFPAEFSASMWREGGAPSFGAIVRDITDRRRDEERLYHLAHHDQMTGLPNRSVLTQRITTEIEHSRPGALIVVDLNDFKGVNDTLGHRIGDMLLHEAAQRLRACVRPIDTVARIGSDDFAIFLPDIGDPLRAVSVAETAMAALKSPCRIEGHDIAMAASAGVALYPAHCADAEEMLANADLALSETRRTGGGVCRLFTPLMRQTAMMRRQYDIEIRRAIMDGEFEVHYQPQVRLIDGALVGAEALLRWRHPQRGLVSPAAFIPFLEEGLLAATVGDWVLETACAQAGVWRRKGATDFRIGVNLFGAQFRTDGLVASVDRALERAGLEGDALELEVTENIILHHDGAMLKPLKALRERGVAVAFDDYGTGYASLSMLKRFPLTRLKIDQSFVRDLCSDAEDAAVVQAVIFLAESFRLEVIAEGIETPAQLAALMALGCAEGQGFLFGKPVTAKEFELAYLAETPLAARA